jgi:hypothetical protein
MLSNSQWRGQSDGRAQKHKGKKKENDGDNIGLIELHLTSLVGFVLTYFLYMMPIY